MQLSQNIHRILVPAAIAEIAVGQRPVNGKYAVQRDGYHVAKDLQFIGFYCILKSLSKPGIIYEVSRQIDELKSLTNMGARTIYYYLKECHKRKYLIYKKNQVQLHSWDCLFDYYAGELHDYGLEQSPYLNRFIPIEYEQDNKLHTPRYLMILAEVKHNQAKQAYMIEKKLETIQNHQDQSSASMQKKEPTETKAVTLFQWILLYRSGSFVGSEDTSAFYCLNACLNRGLKGFKKSFQFKHKHRVTYLKNQMEKRELVVINRDNRVYDLTSALRPGGPSPKFHPIYDALKLRAGYCLPDDLVIIDQMAKSQMQSKAA